MLGLLSIVAQKIVEYYSTVYARTNDAANAVRLSIKLIVLDVASAALAQLRGPSCGVQTN